MDDISRIVTYAEKDACSLLHLCNGLVREGYAEEAMIIAGSVNRIISSLKRITHESRLQSRVDLLETESLSII